MCASDQQNLKYSLLPNLLLALSHPLRQTFQHGVYLLVHFLEYFDIDRSRPGRKVRRSLDQITLEDIALYLGKLRQLIGKHYLDYKFKGRKLRIDFERDTLLHPDD
jgi:hypothetical protein